ncbi:trypsin-like peptidase domain-containing protein [Streptomyces sp. AC550_RSS872]|uniref:trypsin-like peptidase domain-containing protein n=1 Tax=Streptomyces sp. AC550_RSS872 TaxID=2823689 RepID=UPI001C27E5CD|nr:trypsin-like serine protease [Streptomyces sp. AC550_RSS872]
MTGGDYWVRISEGGRPLGAGFLLAPVYVLTAMHCLRGADTEYGRLELELADGRVMAGRLCDSVKENDLALIHIDDAHQYDLPLPPVDWPRPHVRWRSTYCPSDEQTKLSGRVSHAPILYRSVEGGEFAGLQLTVEQGLGDYSGYSGSPVDTGPAVVGILMEQQYSREDPSKGSEVLVAASVRHAMDLFPHFGMESLRNGGQAPEEPCEPTGQAGGRNVVRDVEVVLKALRQWEEAGYITQEEAQEQRGRTLRKFGDRALGGDPDA